MFLGIDAGGTSCRTKLVDINSTLLGSGLSGPANTRLGAAAVMASIQTAISQSFHDAGLSQEELSDINICVGLAGISRKGVLDELRANSFWRTFSRIEFVSDAFIAHIGAHDPGDGGTVIVGTGSVGIATVGGEILKVGGDGFPNSDLGSGAHIGLMAVQQTLLAKDAVGQRCELTDEMLSLADTPPKAIASRFHDLSPTEYAGYAPVVVKHAEAGDELAVSILRKAADHIEGMLLRLRDFGAPKLCIVGGLGPPITARLSTDIRKLLVRPLAEPVDGAIAVARMNAEK